MFFIIIECSRDKNGNELSVRARWREYDASTFWQLTQSHELLADSIHDMSYRGLSGGEHVVVVLGSVVAQDRGGAACARGPDDRLLLDIWFDEELVVTFDGVQTDIVTSVSKDLGKRRNILKPVTSTHFLRFTIHELKVHEVLFRILYL